MEEEWKHGMKSAKEPKVIKDFHPIFKHQSIMYIIRVLILN
jgi:hypothetical protein